MMVTRLSIHLQDFEDMGHVGLVGENTERFIEEVDAVHRQSKKETEERA